jgi:hypothetical protein
MKEVIKLGNLLLNNDNPRYEHQDSQRSAILKMLQDQSKKIYKLAESIVENGVNPSELTIVSKNNGSFKVLEGNRRVLALKLLNNPKIIEDEQDYVSIFKSFSNLHQKFNTNPILELDCVVFENDDDANYWIKLKHTGENNGVGIVSWNRQQIERFDEKVSSKKSIALSLLKYLRTSSKVSSEIKALLDKVPTSSLDRLLTDKNVQEVIGFIIENKKIKSLLPEEEVIKGLQKIIKDLATKSIKVKDIYTKEDREKYLESFVKEDVPSKEEVYDKPWEMETENSAPQQKHWKKRKRKEKAK